MPCMRMRGSAGIESGKGVINVVGKGGASGSDGLRSIVDRVAAAQPFGPTEDWLRALPRTGPGFGKGLGVGKGELDSGVGKGLDLGGKGVSKGLDNDVIHDEPCPQHLLPAVSRNRNYFTVGISSDIISAVRRATEQHANS